MAGYQRQDDDGNISNGNIIDATDLNGEFDAIESAFNASTGHTHDGTDGQGARIEETGPAGQFTFTGTGMFPASGQNSLDLGSSGNRFDNAFFTSEVTTANLDVETSATITSLTIGSSTAVTSVDTDLASVSANDDTLASALAIKTYIDSQVTAQDLDITDGTNTSSIDLDSQSLTFSGSTGISATVSGQTITFTTSDGDIVHDNLSGYVSAEHVDHSGVSITAGNGLTGGGTIESTRDLAVGAGTGITVNADDVALSHLGLESLTDPGADRVAFWDDSESAFKWLTMGTNLAIDGTTLNATDTDTTYSTATSSAQGLVKLLSDTQQTVAAQTVSATSGRTYGVQLNGSNQMVVNVPWTDTDNNTTYSAGTNISLDGTTFNVDDAFVSNSGDTITGRLIADFENNDKIILRGSNSPSIEFQNAADTFVGRVGVSELNDEARLVSYDSQDSNKIHVLGVGRQGLRYSTNNGGNYYKVWHENNDGSGSGLDADKLDGYHASSFQYAAGKDLDLNGTTFDIESELNYVNAIKTASGVDFTLTTQGDGDMFFVAGGDTVYFRGTTSGEEIKFELTEATQTIYGSDQLFLSSPDTQIISSDTLTFRSAKGLYGSTPEFVFKSNTAQNYPKPVDIVLEQTDTVPAADQIIGAVRFRAENSASTLLDYAKITSIIEDTTDGTIDGSLEFSVRGDGTFHNITWSGEEAALKPGTDDLYDLGTNLAKWDDIYATNGTIQTSDVNAKQDIEAISEAETRVAQALKGLLRKYRWISAVEEKGDAARYHFGIIAQDVEQAFEDEGLDPFKYAMLTKTTLWTEDYTVVEQEADPDNGLEQVLKTKQRTYSTAEEAPEGATETTTWGVRYPELLAFIIAGL